MADKLAVLNSGLTAATAYPAQAADVRSVYPNLSPSFPVNDASFAEYPRVVIVREDPDPALTFGQRIAAPLPAHVEKRNGTWHLKKIVVSPDVTQTQELKQQLLTSAEQVAAGKRQELTSAQLLMFVELKEMLADATPTAAEYPLIAAFAQGRTDGGQATTLIQARDLVQTFRTNWMTRAAQIERKHREVIVKINNASTLADARAVLAELEAIT